MNVIAKTTLKAFAHPYLVPIENESQYHEVLNFTESIWDEVLDNPHSPYGTLLGILTERISAYEAEHHTIPDAKAEDVLAFLLEQHATTLAKVAQAVDIPAEKLVQGFSAVTMQELARLASYFHVHPTVFIANES